MLALAPRRMDADEFLAWVVTLPKGERFELDGGEVVAMAAERAAHAEAKFAVTASLKAAIKQAGLRCQAFIDGLAVRIDQQTVYEPDALVRCGEPVDPDTVTINDPLVVVEVVSPSSATIDPGAKLDDYFRLESVRHYLIVKTRNRTVIHHRRDGAGRIETRILTGGALALDPPGIEVEIGDWFGEGAG